MVSNPHPRLDTLTGMLPRPHDEDPLEGLDMAWALFAALPEQLVVILAAALGPDFDCSLQVASAG